MRNLLFAIALLLPMPVMAEDSCYWLAKLAEQIMELRQQNVPITQILDSVDDPDSIKAIVLMAYKMPMQKLPSKKHDIAVEFGNLFYVVCAENEEPKGISL